MITLAEKVKIVDAKIEVSVGEDVYSALFDKNMKEFRTMVAIRDFESACDSVNEVIINLLPLGLFNRIRELCDIMVEFELSITG